jgi:hypothetical protein
MNKIYLLLLIFFATIFFTGCESQNSNTKKLIGTWEPSIYQAKVLEYQGYHHLVINSDGTYSKYAFVTVFGIGLFLDSDTINVIESGKYTYDNEILYFEYFDQYENRIEYDYEFKGENIYSATYYSDGTLNDLKKEYEKIDKEELLSPYVGEWNLDTDMHTDIQINRLVKYNHLIIGNNYTYYFNTDDESELYEILVSRNCLYLPSELTYTIKSFEKLKIELIDENHLLLSGDYYSEYIEVYYVM